MKEDGYERSRAIGLGRLPMEVAKKYENYLEEVHNKYVNSDEFSEALEVVMTLCQGAEGARDGEFEQYRVNRKVPISGVNIVKVYLSGFIL